MRHAATGAFVHGRDGETKPREQYPAKTAKKEQTVSGGEIGCGQRKDPLDRSIASSGTPWGWQMRKIN